jgi:hypothetical protein
MGIMEFPSLFLLTSIVQLVIAVGFLVIFSPLLMDTIVANVEKIFFNIYVITLLNYFYVK